MISLSFMTFYITMLSSEIIKTISSARLNKRRTFEKNIVPFSSFWTLRNNTLTGYIIKIRSLFKTGTTVIRYNVCMVSFTFYLAFLISKVIKSRFRANLYERRAFKKVRIPFSSIWT